MPIVIGGHRGFGCTDHEFYAIRRTFEDLPVENTLKSVLKAFNSGADFVEIDAVQSLDGRIFLLHSVVPSDHIFHGYEPEKPLNRLDWAEISRLKTGRNGTGEICLLREALGAIKVHDPKTSNFAVNIELKGNQGSGQEEPESFIENVIFEIAASGLRADRILFSSFSLETIIRMAKLLPEASYGMLFFPTGAGTIAFDMKGVTFVETEFGHHRSGKTPELYLHPEVTALSDEMLTSLGRRGRKFNTWPLFEELTPKTIDNYRRLFSLAVENNIHLGVITDYIDEMRQLLNRNLGLIP
jgi:glycerophosphoryl diester phosphodiesterase